MATIIVSRDQQVLQEVEVRRARIILGRHPSCDIVIDDRAVSAQHVSFDSTGEHIYIQDLDSTNGTYVNGRRIGRQLLADGDHIALARFQISFIKDGTSQAAPPQVGAIEVTSGPNAGKVLHLTKPVSTLGRQGVQVVAITRQGEAYFFQHLEGEQVPLLDGQPAGGQRLPLRDGAVIELVGTRMVFRLAGAPAA